jgi:hypothetical protein
MNGLGTVARTMLGNSGAIGSALGSMGTGGAMMAGKMFGASSWAGANAAFSAGSVSAGIPGLTWASTGAASGATTGAAAKVRAGGGGIHTPDGSHAGGLSYVPFDGYQAVRHQGERVLTRQENLRYATPTQPVDWAPLLAEVRELKRAVFASSSSVRQGVDETTREVKRQTRGYTRRVA